MLIIPAIDIKEGKCVRLKQGVFLQKTVYSEHPEEVALYFQNLGAKRLHVVDLDGAKTGTSKNRALIREILSEVQIPIQLGGGIRSFAQVEQWLNLGIESIIIGTMAVKQPEVVEQSLQQFGSERLILAVDARDGKVAIEGWQRDSEVRAVDLVQYFKHAGIERILYTDISRDGMLSGPNLSAIKEMAVSTRLKVTASGGISSKQDLIDLEELESFGVDSVIVGRAFYECRISPEEVF